MPFYAFYCPACGQQSEAFLTMADRDAVGLAPVCPPGKQHRGQYRMVRLQTPVTGIVRNPAVPRSQRGYYMPDFAGAMWFLFLSGVFIGGVLFAGLPWLWRLLKPWIHAVTG